MTEVRTRSLELTLPAADDVIRFGFMLLPEFPLYALVPAIEGLRIANQQSGRRLFDWKLISLDGNSVKACSGLSMTVDAGVADVTSCPNLLVFAGNHPIHHCSKRLLSWLRKLARHGSILGGVDTGQFALAEAGLLRGYRATVHWESLTTFRDRYPDITIAEQLYTVDRDRMTCAGGHATLDLILTLISRSHGTALAQVVANSFLAQRVRGPDEPQRIQAQQVAGTAEAPFARVIRDMEHHLEIPLSATELARRAGVSVRALTRVLRTRTGEPPMRYYRKVRLQAARNALFYNDVPIQDIAASCGFSSPEVFSRTFRKHFGVSPRAFRQAFAREELRRFRPELEQQLKAI